MIRFENTGRDFSALHAVEAWLKEHGYSHGPLQRGEPIGVLRGDWVIAKWRNLTASERNALDGRIEWRNGSARNGDAVLILRESEASGE